jgi:8-oxo-dGTP pyrophosphatase MutT (NUDIX family)
MIYRITIEALDPGEEGLTSVSFFASTPHDILVAARELREQLGCTASHATRLALGYSLIDETTYRLP